MMVRPIPRKLRGTYELYEFLAHTLAYNAHLPKYQTNSQTYSVRPSDITVPYAGLVYYILDPLGENNNDIKILFRGTKDLASVYRDLESGAPGHTTFQESVNFILHSLQLAIADVIRKNNTETVSVTICGHSLGAADAQNFFAALIQKMHDWRDAHVVDDDEIHYKKISAVNLAAFNSPGVTHAVAAQAEKDAEALSAMGVKLSCFWMLAERDAVQQAGEENLLVNVAPDVATVHLVKTRHHYSDEYNSPLSAHTTHFFNEKSYLKHNHHYYCNKDPLDRPIISEKLNHKSLMLQHPVFDYSKTALKYLVQMIYSAVNLKLYQYDGTSQSLVLSQDCWIDVSSLSLSSTNPAYLSATLTTPTTQIILNFSPENLANFLRNSNSASSSQLLIQDEEKQNDDRELSAATSQLTSTSSMLVTFAAVLPGSKVIIEELKEDSAVTDTSSKVTVTHSTTSATAVTKTTDEKVLLLPYKNTRSILTEIDKFIAENRLPNENIYEVFRGSPNRTLREKKLDLAISLKNLIAKSGRIYDDVRLAVIECKRMNNDLDLKLRDGKRDAFHASMEKISGWLTFDRNRFSTYITVTPDPVYPPRRPK